MKGICFIEPLHKATIAETKTQTRRIVVPTKKVSGGISESLFNEDNTIGCVFYTNGVDVRAAKPRFNVGEFVYLKEPYVDDCLQGEVKYKYCAEDVEYLISAGFEEELNIPGFWKNKLFMPQSLAKHFIKITGVRLEALQDISNEDCIKEGIKKIEGKVIGYPFGVSFNYSNGYANYQTPKEAYANLIDRINGNGTWDSNPFVWVYDYELRLSQNLVDNGK